MGYTLENSTHLDTVDRPALGRTAPELGLLFLALLVGGGALHQPGLPLALRLAECVGLVLAALVAVLYRPQGRSLVAWAQLIAAYLVADHEAVWTPSAATAEAPAPPGAVPPHLADRLATVPPTASSPESPAGGDPEPDAESGHQTPAPRLRPRTQDRPYVPVAIQDTTVIFRDGRRLAVLECSGPATNRLDEEGERALHVALHRALLGWPFPLQILVWADPLDLGAYTAQREADLASLPSALRPLFSTDISFMRREARRLGALDLRTFVVVPGPTVRAGLGAAMQGLLRRRLGAGGAAAVLSPEDQNRLLSERCAAVTRGLAGARVQTWRLGDAELDAVWYRLLCPRSARVQPLDAGHHAPVLDPTVRFHA